MTSKVYSWKCEKCGKVIESLSKKQFDFNQGVHQTICEKEKEK